MSVDDLPYSSSQLLNLIESYGITGTWKWAFSSNDQIWSLGLFNIIGVEQQAFKPSYDLFLRFVHFDDRDKVPTAAEVVQGITGVSQVFRIVRPDRSIRIISARSKVYYKPDGTPIGAAGVILDITDQEKLKSALIAEEHRKRALFEQMRIIEYSNSLDRTFVFPQELSELTGLPLSEIAEDIYVTIVTEEREHWRGVSIDAQKAGVILMRSPLCYTAGHGQERFELLTVPVRNEHGDIVEWSSLGRTMNSAGPSPCDGLRKGLEQAIEGRHLRAARALLDWSMSDFAKVAGLSLSTVKRLEQVAGYAMPSSHYRAVQTLRSAGIWFSLMDGGSISVGKR